MPGIYIKPHDSLFYDNGTTTDMEVKLLAELLDLKIINFWFFWRGHRRRSNCRHAENKRILWHQQISLLLPAKNDIPHSAIQNASLSDT